MSAAVAEPQATARSSGTEAGAPGLQPGPAGHEPAAFDDRLARAVGIPGFGLSIPHLTDLFGPLGPPDPEFWAGSAWFLLLSAAIWHGNRWLLFEQRRHYDWFAHPARKIVMLLAAIVLYTAPLTIAALAAWYRFAGFETIDWETVKTVALVNVICVVIVTHAYETVFLIKERESDLVRVARLDRARAEAELAAFLAQVDPHFLFNSLNTIGHLADTEPARAREFADQLADIYRYLLRHRGRSLVRIEEELGFVEEYVALMRLRFGEAIRLSVRDRAPSAGRGLPPTTLQLLVENAIKHSRFSRDEPLEVTIELRRRTARVENPLRPRSSARGSSRLGLAYLSERVRLVTGASPRVHRTEDAFSVEVPLAEEAP